MNNKNYKFGDFIVLKSGVLNFWCTNKKCSANVVDKLNQIIKVTITLSYDEYNNQIQKKLSEIPLNVVQKNICTLN